MRNGLTRLVLALVASWRRAFPHGDPALKAHLARALVRERNLTAEVARLTVENSHLGLALVTAERLLKGVCAMAAGPQGVVAEEEAPLRPKRRII